LHVTLSKEGTGECVGYISRMCHSIVIVENSTL